MYKLRVYVLLNVTRESRGWIKREEKKLLAPYRNFTLARVFPSETERMVIVVEIEDRCAEKPFLGGWRNVVTGTEYHDALTQTCPGDQIYRGAKEDLTWNIGVARRKANVNTQTNENILVESTSVMVLESCCKYTSTSSDQATQTSRLPDLRDKLVTPLALTLVKTARPRSSYRKALLLPMLNVLPPTELSSETRITEDKRMHFTGLEETSAVKIQRFYRAYRTRLNIEALAHLSRETRPQTPPEPEKIQYLRHCRETQFEIINASLPKNRSDFEILQNVLGRWRLYENDRIDRNFFDTSKLAARTMVLLKEIEILRSIETIKTRVRCERRQRRYLEHLEKLAEPEVWTMSNGKEIIVETQRVQRARECRDFYKSLLREYSSIEERCETLKNLKRYAIEHTCRLGRDVVTLIDQEIELLSHSFDTKSMDPLRNRLKIALLRLSMSFCEPRNFNLEKKSQKSFINKRRVTSKLCNRCGKFLHLDNLISGIALNDFVTCNNCNSLRIGKAPTIVYEPYEIMLRELRSREAAAQGGQTQSPAFAVDPRVIYRLVNYVWHGKSGISECNDLFRLTLVRFRAEREWSPWNTLLLTKREASLHQSINDPFLIYSSSLIKKFIVKNLQAKLRFDFLSKTRLS